MTLRLKLIAAASENMGIGKNGDLPWRLKKEMAYFTKMTQLTKDPNKKNVVIMGRRTWVSIPTKYKPLSKRINVVLTKNPSFTVPQGVLIYNDFNTAIIDLEKNEQVENIWIIGGASIYQAAIDHPSCYRIYLTEIKKIIDCDTFFPKIDKSKFKLLTDHGDESSLVPNEKQIEDGFEYYFRIYEKI